MSKAPRLSLATLGNVPPSVARPGYDPAAVACGVVHLGVGAFHRAHQAVYFDEALARGERGWGVLGASLRSLEMQEALAPQDGLYTLLERGAGGARARVVGSLRAVLSAPQEGERLMAALADPRIRIVTLTVTEKGYHHDPAAGELNEDDPAIRRDLADPHRPATAPGLLVEALRRRRDAGMAPFTVASCDNLPANGASLRRIASRMASLRDPGLGAFVAREVAFPCSMVDRIVPATTPADREEAAALLGLVDAWPVSAEPFTQWVVEDDFPAGRPDLTACGVQMVRDVAPFEAAKLRLLNGSHSMIAYLGYLAGYETVAEAVADAELRALVARTMARETAPTLKAPPELDLATYQARLLERFANPALRHRTWQIAMDGSQKVPQRLLGTIRDALAAGRPFPCLALGLAAWMRFACGMDEAGRGIDVRDPLAAKFAEIARRGGGAQNIAEGFFAIEPVFGGDLPRNPVFHGAVTLWLDRLFARGAAESIRACLAEGDA